jgi:hypothetical protein
MLGEYRSDPRSSLGFVGTRQMRLSTVAYNTEVGRYWSRRSSGSSVRQYAAVSGRSLRPRLIATVNGRSAGGTVNLSWRSGCLLAWPTGCVTDRLRD